MKIVQTLAVLLAFTLNAEARIGETLAQCTARYGKPSTSPYRSTNVAVFTTSRFYVNASLFEEKVDQIEYVSWIKISPNEIEVLLKANGGAMMWVRKDRSVWHTTSGLWATYTETEMDSTLLISTQAHREREAAEKAKAAAYAEARAAKAAADVKAKELNALKGF